MTSISSVIESNYHRIVNRIADACGRCGRELDSVKLIAVVKYAELEWVRSLLELGVRELGESRPQQLVERAAQFDAGVHWHLIGHLQRNKARRVLPLVEMIHAVDTLRLLKSLDRLGEETAVRRRVLLQVNISGEAAKHGIDPDELLADWQTVLSCRHVAVAGLMTMAPLSSAAEAARPTFRGLRELRNRLCEESGDQPLPELSMGMTHDFEVAIEEGATLVRIGSALFQGL